MAALWPDGGELSGPRADAAQRAQVLSTTSASDGTLRVELALLGDGAVGDDGQRIMVQTWADGQPEVREGDRVKAIVAQVPSLADDGTWQLVDAYQLIDFDRSSLLVALTALFILTVLAVGGWRGLRALLGLAVSLAVVLLFVVPAILAGQSPVPVALVAGCVIMIVTIYSSHGRAPHVTAAALGTLAALAATAALAVWFVTAGQITGLVNEHAYAASVSAGGLDLTGLVLAGLIIATLGVLDDVTVSQASTVWALYSTDPTQSRWQLFARAMQVGRDHIAAVVNTLFLAYTGASLALLVLFFTSGLPAGEIVASEAVAEELIKTLVGSIGLTLAVPLTTALAAALVEQPTDSDRSHTHHRH